MSQAVGTEEVDAHGEVLVEDRSRNFGMGAMTRRFGWIGCCCRSYLEGGGVGVAFGVAGLVWEVVEEVCFGDAVVFEENCRAGDWSLRGVVVKVDVESLIACVAVGRRVFVLPVSMGLGSASAQGAESTKIYLFRLCVSDTNVLVLVKSMGIRTLLLTQEAHPDYNRCYMPF